MSVSLVRVDCKETPSLPTFPFFIPTLCRIPTATLSQNTSTFVLIAKADYRCQSLEPVPRHVRIIVPQSFPRQPSLLLRCLLRHALPCICDALCDVLHGLYWYPSKKNKTKKNPPPRCCKQETNSSVTIRIILPLCVRLPQSDCLTHKKEVHRLTAICSAPNVFLSLFLLPFSKVVTSTRTMIPWAGSLAGRQVGRQMGTSRGRHDWKPLERNRTYIFLVQ